MNAPAWLTARPFAHRGLHDNAQGIIENSTAAATAAIAKNYAIECDVQCTKDGEAVVFHDVMLDRLTLAEGDVGARRALEITRLPYRHGTGTVARLADFLATIDGRVPVIVEIKSRIDGDIRLAERVARIAASYAGPLALQSFDPDVLAQCRTFGVAAPLGLVAQADYEDEDWQTFTEETRARLVTLIDFPSIAPDFLAWRAIDLPHPVPLLCRSEMDMPVLAWTLRDAASRDAAMQSADQVIFEGFDA